MVHPKGSGRGTRGRRGEESDASVLIRAQKKRGSEGRRGGNKREGSRGKKLTSRDQAGKQETLGNRGGTQAEGNKGNICKLRGRRILTLGGGMKGQET